MNNNSVFCVFLLKAMRLWALLYIQSYFVRARARGVFVSKEKLKGYANTRIPISSQTEFQPFITHGLYAMRVTERRTPISAP